MANLNTLSENMSQLTKSVNETLSLINGYTEASSSNDSTVEVKLADGSTVTMPSYGNVAKRLGRVEDTMAAFVQGSGVVETDDGTFRKVQVTTVPKSPKRIESVANVTTFNADANWIFEDFMFPKCVISVDLKNQIDDNSDRVYVNRVILDYTNYDVEQYYRDNIMGTTISYASLIESLNTDGIPYTEDIEELSLPLTFEKYYGNFVIQSVKNEDGELWYYLDTINYKQVDINGNIISSSYRLSVGDYIRYNDSLFKIAKIDQASKKVTIEYSVGFESPAVGAEFSVYNEPFADKTVKIGIGIDEINIIYIKGVNENYNILSKDWSDPIMFISNELTYGNTDTTLQKFYNENVMDFGKELIARAKEGRVSAYNGERPNTPELSLDYLKVVQINTQLNATLESETYTNLVSSIYTAKSSIEDLRKSISSDKEKLIKSTDADERTKIQNNINNNTTTLSTETTKYNSLVEELNTMLNENGAIGYSPKYHVRGFFPIPEPKYSDETTKTGKQEIIGFDIMYRYVHTDETGTELSTFKYKNGDSKDETSAVFSDWCITTSQIREQIFDEDLDMYVWKDNNVSDGNEININQIDIPIRSGEKVQIKVRAISEAGYPSNPLKSEWSNIVTVGFPDNLTANDAVTATIDNAKNDLTSVVLQETMSAAGVYTHLDDSDDKYKHQADRICVSYRDKNAQDQTKILTVSLKDFLNMMTETIQDCGLVVI